MGQGSATAASAVRHLRRQDPVLGDLIRRIGPCRFAVRDGGSHFEALARSIVYQQLSGAAAGTIYRRVTDLLRVVEPQAVQRASDEHLRAAGLSRQKTAYLRDLAAHAGDGGLDLGVRCGPHGPTGCARCRRSSA